MAPVPLGMACRPGTATVACLRLRNPLVGMFKITPAVVIRKPKLVMTTVPSQETKFPEVQV